MNEEIKYNHLLKTGDTIFIRVNNFLYRRVAEATNSWTSHVGMVHSKENGEWVIAESTIPVSRLCPLHEFLQKSGDNKFSIKRPIRDLSQTNISNLQKEANKHLGQSYTFGFDFNSKNTYCSKFLYQIYKKVLDEKIGDIETFQKLLTKTPNMNLWFWRLWFFGKIPWQRFTVTPESLYQCPNLRTVYENNI